MKDQEDQSEFLAEQKRDEEDSALRAYVERSLRESAR